VLFFAEGGEVFYAPSKFGYAKEIRKRMEYWKRLKSHPDKKPEEAEE
jgi:hypothetical protein